MSSLQRYLYSKPSTREFYLIWQIYIYIAGVIKLRILRWGDYLGSSWWTLNAHGFLQKGTEKLHQTDEDLTQMETGKVV